jgi:hypothetical protein
VSELVLTRLRDVFLAPGAEAPARQVAERAVPATLGMLAPAQQVAERVVPATLAVLATGPRDAAVAGAALALAAARAHRSRCAVVCRWDGAAAATPRAGTAVVSARRLAERLAGRGLAAAANGRLVTVALPAAGGEARAATERTLAASGDVPVVLVVSGPRPPALDPLLATLDRLVVVPAADAPPGLERLALDAAARLGRGVSVLRVPDGATTTGRLLAATGLPLSPRLCAAATAALAGGDG